MIIMALFGGTGTVFGPVLGAALLSITNEVIGAKLLYTYLLMLGFIILFVIIFLPRGIVSLLSLRWFKR
jgi:branched-chain amino acid transport system permease protein